MTQGKNSEESFSISMAKQKHIATTQAFTEIEDIIDDVVLLSGGQACLIIEVTATNFTLQSQEEQEVKILSYASLLNSLSYPIQILIISRKLDISYYLSLLEKEAAKAENGALSYSIRLYKDFVSQLVSQNTVLDKKFYLIVSFSFLEKGATGIAQSRDKAVFITDAKNLLHSKVSSVAQELGRIGLKSKILEKDQLIKLFYEIYNNPPPGEANIAEGMGIAVAGVKRP